MESIETFLENLLSVPGLSGYEKPAGDLIQQKWTPLSDEINISRLGSLHALRKASITESCPTLMLAAHMDAIGLMVKEIKDAFLLVTQVGGVDTRVLPGQAVIIHGTRALPGIVQMLPDRLLPAAFAGKPPKFSTLFVDTGLSAKELGRVVRVGDIISFATTPKKLNGGYIYGHSLDNRASVAALTVCMEEIRNFNLQCNTWFTATVMEEEHLIGAATSTFQLMPDLAIAVDVTFAKEAGANDHRSFPLGKGPTIGIGANNHPGLHREFKKIADMIDLPVAVETMPRSSGTDGMAMQITAAGIPTLVIGIPIRYMHTPVELTSLQDIHRAGRLLARFITGLNSESMASLLQESPTRSKRQG